MEINMPDTTPHFTIFQVNELTEQVYQACQRLVPQLTNNNLPPTREELASMQTMGSSILFLAQVPDFEGEQTIGMATLVLYRVPTGMRGIIEDVVVDESVRGRRIGEALMYACLERAQQAGCPQVMLTSNPSRVAANRLYQRMGFELRNTNVYRYNFKVK
jgi:ribosomal protein S18 acetylase RimI-like enzyme